MLSYLISILAIAPAVLGHGMMIFPPARLNASDPGFKDTVNTNKALCHNLPSGSVTATVSNGIPLDVNWLIFIPHNGTCEFSIAYDGTNFEKIGTDPKCASSKAVYKAQVTLPKDKVSDKAVLRWAYHADNQEIYEACSDIKVIAGSAPIEAPKTSPSSLDAPTVLNVTLVKEKGLLSNDSTASTPSDGSSSKSSAASNSAVYPLIMAIAGALLIVA